VRGVEHGLLLGAAMQLPAAERAETRDRQQGAEPQEEAAIHHRGAPAADNVATFPECVRAMQKLLIIAVLVAILWNLGAGLYYMMVDKGTTDRTVRALSWRIGISVALILMVCVGIYTGWIKPHGIYH
jgi:hypothetical protein